MSKIREEAATICAIAASRPASSGHDGWANILARDLGFDPGAATLADAAWSHALAVLGCDAWSPLLDAEAEALIRTGWRP